MEIETSSYDEKTLTLPRILCLHGGGTNARIFQSQCRVIIMKLEAYFRLVFAEAPYESKPGPGVDTVYCKYTPYKRWLRWLPEDDETDDQSVINDLDQAIKSAMFEDDRKGATGEWVALLGFSQGAKLAMSLLIRQHRRSHRLVQCDNAPRWMFGVILAGRAPPVSLDADLSKSSMLCDPSQLDIVRPPDMIDAMGDEHRVTVPTIHMHGLRDQGLHLHQEMLEDYCVEGTTRLIEWDAAHVVPAKRADIMTLVTQILAVAIETGALREEVTTM